VQGAIVLASFTSKAQFVKANLALPPDVRRGLAAPFSAKIILGLRKVTD
jgi:hypothetical protein